ncbi:MAG: hypothetical protein HFG66_02350 [Hungatella sp.]|nr:hypothetical protein [Hungatella sp.]
MQYSYCTLFDKNYLDKGLLTLRSLKAVNQEARIYALAMDDDCEKVLHCESGIYVISLGDLLDDKLIAVRENRTKAEFCWTCTASLILYVLEKYDESICTYIDADMFFYSNPDILVNEMINAGKSVLIIEHRIKNDFMGRLMLKNAGRFCVEFNTFMNTDASLKVLKDWRNKTIEHCSSDSSDGKPKGDQSYLEDWPFQYDNIYISTNIGAGIAPWNLDRYSVFIIDDKPYVAFDGNGKHRVLFYHFHNLQYIEKHKVNINVFTVRGAVDKRTVYYFYYRYLLEIDRIKNEIQQNYGFLPLLTYHPGIVRKYNHNRKYYIKKLFSKELAVSIRSRYISYLLRKKYAGDDILVF